MNIYPTLMDTDLERFELLFSYKRKTLEDFVSLMNERADLEENYAKAIDRISTSLSIYSEKGPLADVLNSLKSYNSVKSEQSKIFAASIRGEIIQSLKDIIKKENSEARKTASNARKNDLDMRSIMEKIETVRKKYITVNTDLEEAQKTKALLFNIEMTDANTEDRKKNIVDKLTRLTNTCFDCDAELKTCIEDYNKFKKTFTEQSNLTIDYFKQFDATRVNTIRDSVMKYFVYEISYVRNIQYDVNRIIQNVENGEVNKDMFDSHIYKPRTEPLAIDFESFKETFVKKVLEGKSKNGIGFDKTQIPENLGLTTAFKSIVGFFAPKNSTDLKKKEDEAKFLEKYWTAVSHGLTLMEGDEQNFSKILAIDYNRKLFINLFSKIDINLDNVSAEEYNKAKDTILQTLSLFLNETWLNKDWESLKLYVSSMKRLKRSNNDELEKEDIYTFLDENLRSLEIFNNETAWKEYLYQNVARQGKIISLQKMALEIANLRHFIKNKELLNSIITSVAQSFGISEENIDKLLDDNIENTLSDYSSEGSLQDLPQPKENEKLDIWMRGMEQKINKLEKTRVGGGKIFSQKPHSNPLSPLTNITSSMENNQIASHSESDKTLQSDFRKAPKPFSNLSKPSISEHIEDNDESTGIENSYSVSTASEARDMTSSNLQE